MGGKILSVTAICIQNVHVILHFLVCQYFPSIAKLEMLSQTVTIRLFLFIYFYIHNFSCIFYNNYNPR